MRIALIQTYAVATSMIALPFGEFFKEMGPDNCFAKGDVSN
jgi:hypothetical protein